MTPAEAKAELEQEPPLLSSAPELIGWEPLTHPISESNEQDLIELIHDYQEMSLTKNVRIVRDSDGRLCLWEQTPRVHAWLSPEIP